MGVKRLLTVSSITLLGIVCSVILLCNWSALGFRSLSVPTGSMRPNITPGSLVLVHRVPIASLKVGDVITYANPLHAGQTISHRVIETYLVSGKVPGFVTKGDANKVPDVPITSGSVIGKVVWHVPHLGGWMQWSKSWLGIAALVYLPALLLMSEEVQRMAAYLKRSLPYRLPGSRLSLRKKLHPNRPKYATAGVLATVLVLASAALAQPALALLKSSPVHLSPNRLSLAATTTQGGGSTTTTTSPTNVTCTNNNNVSVGSTSNQTATSGTATNTGNTNSAAATSGNASNSNSTNVNVTITNGC